MRKQIIDNVDIELPEFDANELNSLMYEMVEAFVYALGHQSNRKTKVESSELLQALLRVFVVTHKSMLLLLHRELSDPLMAADAISLVREQVEKVYVLSLIVDDEQKWTRQYFRSNWRFRYERFLRTQSDHGGKPRFQECLTSYPRILDQGRYVPVESGPNPQVLVTKLMARCVKYSFNNPNAPKHKWPSYFSKKKFDDYFMFPTPGKAIRYIQNKSTQQFLSTWYKEYQWLSRYSHIAVDKVFLNAISQSKLRGSVEETLE